MCGGYPRVFPMALRSQIVKVPGNWEQGVRGVADDIRGLFPRICSTRYVALYSATYGSLASPPYRANFHGEGQSLPVSALSTIGVPVAPGPVTGP